jgi:hypothetical protein
LDKVDCSAKRGLILSGKPRHDVKTDTGFGKSRPYCIGQPLNERAIVWPPHSPEDLIVAALDRNMEMSAETLVAARQTDQSGGNFLGLNRTQAQSNFRAPFQEPVDEDL